MRKNYTLSQRIWAGFGLVIFFGAALGATGYYGLSVLKKVVAVNSLASEFLKREIDHLNWARKLGYASRNQDRVEIEKDEHQCKFGQWYYGASRKEVEQLFPETAPLLAKLEAPHRDLHQTAVTIEELLIAKKRAEAIQYYETQSSTHLTEIQKNLAELRTILDASVNQYGKSADEIARRLPIVILIVSAVVVLLGFAVGFITVSRISGLINRAIGALQNNSLQVTTAANHLASTSQNLAEATTEQASSLAETAASLEELTAMVAKNRDSAQGSSQLADSSKDGAVRGRQVVDEMIQAMAEINHSNEKILVEIEDNGRQMTEIVRVIGEIAEKTKVINEIVFQTKLLSFNASVEAARAGEQGKGFAVVAEEVGKLAQMSGTASSEISEMIGSSIQKVQTIVDSTSSKVSQLIVDAKGKVSAGTRVAEQCQSVLEEIVQNVSEASRMAHDISTASEEQARGVQEISNAMNQLDQVTQTNTVTSADAAQAVNALKAQALSLKDVIEELVVMIRGTTSSEVTETTENARMESPLTSS